MASGQDFYISTQSKALYVMLETLQLCCNLQRPESPGFDGHVGQGQRWNGKGGKAMYDKSAIAERLYADVKLD